MNIDNSQNKPITGLHWLLFTLLMSALLAAFLWLAFWQLERADEKQAILTAIDQAQFLPLSMVDRNSPRFAKVSGRGQYDIQHSFLLDNQVESGVVGVHLITPLKLPGGDWLLVNRGWLKMPLDRSELPAFRTTATPVEISGSLNLPPKTGIRMGGDTAIDVSLPWPRLITYLELDPAAAQLGYPLLPQIIQLDAKSASGYGERLRRPLNFGPEKHRGYAITWFAFALVTVILFIIIIRPGIKKYGKQA
ncbi:MAG: SURF1 family protein [Xanthomonadales bacterium]|nr:SURF1 family protein [Xanthomonadales bacterium]